MPLQGKGLKKLHFDFTQPMILLNFQPQVIVSLICHLTLKLNQLGRMHASNTNIKIKFFDSLSAAVHEQQIFAASGERT